MKKSIRVIFSFFLVVLFLGVIPLPAKKLLSLPEVIWPFEIFVDKNQLYVSDAKSMLHYYSLKDFRYLKQISQKGVGPKETSALPIVTISTDNICIYDFIGKCMYFSRNGDYLKEFRVGRFRRLYPIGKNFVGLKVMQANNKNNIGHEYSIYTYENKEMKYTKLIYYYELPLQKRS